MSKNKNKVKILILKPLLTNEEISKREGEFVSKSECKYIIKSDTDAYYIDEDETDRTDGIKNKKKLLFKFRKNVIPNKICIDAYNALENHAQKKNHNRGAAAGKIKLNKLPSHVGKITKTDKFRIFYKTKSGKVSRDNIGNMSKSNIAGYYDRPDRNNYNKNNKTKKNNTKAVSKSVLARLLPKAVSKSVLARLLPKAVQKAVPKAVPMCRITKFTKDEPEKWKSVIPLVKEADKLFKYLVPDRYSIQISRAKKTPDFQIAKTAYSTITVNYDWRTAIHRDSGDLEEGFGNLCVLEKEKSKTEKDGENGKVEKDGNGFKGYKGYKGYKGCFLAFPRFGACIDVRQGDFLAMDVHEYHSNTELEGNGRLSVVCYLRKKMLSCVK